MLDRPKVLENYMPLLSERLAFVQIEFSQGYEDGVLDNCISYSGMEEIEA